MLVQCRNPKKNPENDPNKTGCPAPNGEFEFSDRRYKDARSVNEDEEGSYSVLVACIYCGYENKIWLIGGPDDTILCMEEP